MEKKILIVTTDQTGAFNRATLDDKALTKKELYHLLGIRRLNGMRLEHYVYKFERENPDYDVEVWERDVS